MITRIQGKLSYTSLGALALALSGCAENPEVQETQQGINLRSAVQLACAGEADTTFDISICADNTHPDPEAIVSPAPEIPGSDGLCDPAPAVSYSVTGQTLTDLYDVGDIVDLTTDGSEFGADGIEGTADDLDGTYAGLDYFQLLPVGEYCVTVTSTALGLVENPITNCGIEVPEGGMAETAVAFQCEGTTISGLDVVVLIEEGPSITDFWYSTDKFQMTCEPAGFNAEFNDIEGGEMTVTFAMYPSGHAHPADPLTALYSDTQYITASPGVDFPASWSPANPTPGTYHVHVTVEDESGMDTEFWAIYHVYEPPASGGLCLDTATWSTYTSGSILIDNGSAASTSFTLDNVTQAMVGEALTLKPARERKDTEQRYIYAGVQSIIDRDGIGYDYLVGFEADLSLAPAGDGKYQGDFTYGVFGQNGDKVARLRASKAIYNTSDSTINISAGNYEFYESPVWSGKNNTTIVASSATTYPMTNAWGYFSCDPADWIDLDDKCVRALGNLPLCDTACPPTGAP